jgi:hypothetical protein
MGPVPKPTGGNLAEQKGADGEVRYLTLNKFAGRLSYCIALAGPFLTQRGR